MKKQINDLREMKANNQKAVWVTAYDFMTAKIAQEATVDMILVGDTLGMCVYGYETTLPVEMEQCIKHTEAVRRGAPDTFLLGDMPFLSYQISNEDAVKNAGRFIKETGCNAIKLEGGKSIAPRIEAIVDAGVAVCGHLGLTPQRISQQGGYKVQCKNIDQVRTLIEDAIAIYEAGIQLLLLEAIPPEVGKKVAELLPIPVYGIGAGIYTDGQLLIINDICGYYHSKSPKFAKQYVDIKIEIKKAIERYSYEVRNKRFPTNEHCYQMTKGEVERLNNLQFSLIKN